MLDSCYVYHRDGRLLGLSTQRLDHLLDDRECTEVPYDDVVRSIIGGRMMLGNFRLVNGALEPHDPAVLARTAATVSVSSHPGRVVAFDGYLARLDPVAGEPAGPTPLIALEIRDGGTALAVRLTGNIRSDRKIFLTMKDDPGVLLGTLTIAPQPAEQTLAVTAEGPYDLYVVNQQYDDFGLRVA